MVSLLTKAVLSTDSNAQKERFGKLCCKLHGIKCNVKYLLQRSFFQLFFVTVKILLAQQPCYILILLFFAGGCTWGNSCRFLHPGHNDKGVVKNSALISLTSTVTLEMQDKNWILSEVEPQFCLFTCQGLLPLFNSIVHQKKHE